MKKILIFDPHTEIGCEFLLNLIGNTINTDLKEVYNLNEDIPASNIIIINKFVILDYNKFKNNIIIQIDYEKELFITQRSPILKKMTLEDLQILLS